MTGRRGRIKRCRHPSQVSRLREKAIAALCPPPLCSFRDRFPDSLSRRETLRSAACGFGSLALTGLVGTERPRRGDPATGVNPLAPRHPHFPARAKRVIFLFMNGGPSQVDSFDWKPELSKRHGEDLGGGRKYFQSPWSSRATGKADCPSRACSPTIARHADDLCLINSMFTDVGNHSAGDPADEHGQLPVRPALGGIVDRLRTRDGEPEPARLHHDQSRLLRRRRAQARLPFLPAATAGTAINEWGGADGTDAPSLKGIRIPYTENPSLDPARQRRQARPDPVAEPVAARPRGHGRADRGHHPERRKPPSGCRARCRGSWTWRRSPPTSSNATG